MKTKITLIMLLTVPLVMLGCSKKEEPKPSGQTQTTSSNMLDGVQKAASDATEAAIEKVKESFTMDVDLEKAVSDLKAEAAKMDAESLQEVAAKYKEAITDKEAELKALMDKLSAIPLAEKMSQEAQALTADIKTLTEGVSALQERFQVYIEALKAKGADVKALMG